MADEKKKKSGKEKKGKKEKKSKPLPIREAILTYSVSQREQELEEVQCMVDQLQVKCDRDRERNERLKEEQELHLRNLLSQVHNASSVRSEEVCREEVLESLRGKMAAERDEQREVQELLSSVSSVEAESARVCAEMSSWHRFGAEERHVLDAAIGQLRKEMADMAETTEDMMRRLRRDFESAQEELHSRVGDDVAQRQAKALKYAERFLDKYTRQELNSNGWLRDEAARTRAEYDALADAVAAIEKENLAIMATLVECHVEDLRVRRNFFLTDDDEDALRQPALQPGPAQGMALVRPLAARDPPPEPEDAASVQLHLLTLQGTRMQPRHAEASDTDSEWPVTRPMLQHAVDA